MLSTVISNNGIAFNEIDIDEIHKLCKKLQQKYLTKLGIQQFKHEKDQFLYENISANIPKILVAIKNEFSKSKFNTLGSEISLSKNSKIQPWKIENCEYKIKIIGKIDRADILNINKFCYVKIIDYKLLHKQLDLNDVKNGINIQTLIYLFAACDGLSKKIHKSKKVIPAGVLYFPLADTLFCTNQKEKEIQFIKENGLLIDSIPILNAIEENILGKIIPAKLKKDGTLYKNSSVICANQFDLLKKDIKNLIINMATSLAKNNITPKPYVSKNYHSCDFCEYNIICSGLSLI
jgi:ATP-dependent helicase/nuclease subunit B